MPSSGDRNSGEGEVLSLIPRLSAWQVVCKLVTDSRWKALRQFALKNAPLWHFEYQLPRRKDTRSRRYTEWRTVDPAIYNQFRSAGAYAAAGAVETGQQNSPGNNSSVAATGRSLLNNATNKVQDLLLACDSVHTHLLAYLEALASQFPTKSGPMWTVPLREHEEGNLHLDVVRERRRVLQSETVHHCVRRVWAALPKDHRGFLGQEVHHVVFAKFYDCCAFDVVDQQMRTQLVEQDWLLRADGRPAIDQERFLTTMLATFDVWCETSDEREFEEFCIFFLWLVDEALLAAAKERRRGSSNPDMLTGSFTFLSSTTALAAAGGDGVDGAQFDAAATAKGLSNDKQRVTDLILRSLGKRNITLNTPSALILASPREQLKKSAVVAKALENSNEPNPSGSSPAKRRFASSSPSRQRQGSPSVLQMIQSSTESVNFGHYSPIRSRGTAEEETSRTATNPKQHERDSQSSSSSAEEGDESQTPLKPPLRRRNSRASFVEASDDHSLVTLVPTGGGGGGGLRNTSGSPNNGRAIRLSLLPLGGNSSPASVGEGRPNWSVHRRGSLRRRSSFAPTAGDDDDDDGGNAATGTDHRNMAHAVAASSMVATKNEQNASVFATSSLVSFVMALSSGVVPPYSVRAPVDYNSLRDRYSSINADPNDTERSGNVPSKILLPASSAVMLPSRQAVGQTDAMSMDGAASFFGGSVSSGGGAMNDRQMMGTSSYKELVDIRREARRQSSVVPLSSSPRRDKPKKVAATVRPSMEAAFQDDEGTEKIAVVDSESDSEEEGSGDEDDNADGGSSLGRRSRQPSSFRAFSMRHAAASTHSSTHRSGSRFSAVAESSTRSSSTTANHMNETVDWGSPMTVSTVRNDASLDCDGNASDDSVDEALVLVDRHFELKKKQIEEQHMKERDLQARLLGGNMEEFDKLRSVEEHSLMPTRSVTAACDRRASAKNRHERRMTVLFASSLQQVDPQQERGGGDVEEEDATNRKALLNRRMSSVGRRSLSIVAPLEGWRAFDTSTHPAAQPNSFDGTAASQSRASFSLDRKLSTDAPPSVREEHFVVRQQRRSVVLQAAITDDEGAFQKLIRTYVAQSKVLTEAEKQKIRNEFLHFREYVQRYTALEDIQVPKGFMKGLKLWRGPMNCSTNSLYEWHQPRCYGLATELGLEARRRFANPFLFTELFRPALVEDKVAQDPRRLTSAGARAAMRQQESKQRAEERINAAFHSDRFNGKDLSATVAALREKLHHAQLAYQSQSEEALHLPAAAVDSLREGFRTHDTATVFDWYIEKTVSVAAGWESTAHRTAGDDNEENDGDGAERTVSQSAPSTRVEDWSSLTLLQARILTEAWVDGTESLIELAHDAPQMRGDDATTMNGAGAEAKEEEHILLVDLLTWRALVVKVGSPQAANPPLRIHQGHRLCARYDYLWEYQNPARTDWIPFPRAHHEHLNPWLAAVKEGDRSRVARITAALHVPGFTPAASVRARSVISSHRSRSSTGNGEHDQLYETALQGKLAGLNGFRDHVVSLTEDGGPMSMTSWDGARHYTSPIRYTVLFFNEQYGISPLRLQEEWTPAPVLRKRFLESRLGGGRGGINQSNNANSGGNNNNNSVAGGGMESANSSFVGGRWAMLQASLVSSPKFSTNLVLVDPFHRDRPSTLPLQHVLVQAISKSQPLPPTAPPQQQQQPVAPTSAVVSVGGGGSTPLLLPSRTAVGGGDQSGGVTPMLIDSRAGSPVAGTANHSPHSPTDSMTGGAGGRASPSLTMTADLNCSLSLPFRQWCIVPKSDLDVGQLPIQTTRSIKRDPKAAFTIQAPPLRQAYTGNLLTQSVKILEGGPSSTSSCSVVGSASHPPPPPAKLPPHPVGFKGKGLTMKSAGRTGGGMATTLPPSKHSLARVGTAGLSAVTGLDGGPCFGLDTAKPLTSMEQQQESRIVASTAGGGGTKNFFQRHKEILQSYSHNRTQRSQSALR